MSIRVPSLLFALTFLAGCSPDPWDAHPMSSPPDSQCRTGHETGYDIYLWECEGGRHVAIFQSCSGMVGCSDPETQTSPCGEPTPIETQLADELSTCTPPPVNRRWP